MDITGNELDYTSEETEVFTIVTHLIRQKKVVRGLAIIVVQVALERYYSRHESRFTEPNPFQEQIDNINQLVHRSDVTCLEQLRMDRNYFMRLRNLIETAGGCPIQVRDLINQSYTGSYYLVDAGYTNAEGFLAPFRGKRYHLKEWDGPAPQHHEEYFNMKHAQARNVIERTFGLLKIRWAILRSYSFFPIRTQCRIVTACCLVHNHIRKEMSVDPHEHELDNLEEEDNDDDYIDTVETSGQGLTGGMPLHNIFIKSGKNEGAMVAIRVPLLFSGYLRKVKGMLLVALPGTSIRANPHISSKLKTDNNASGLRFKSFPYYEDWCMIFGNNRAMEEMAESATDTEVNLDEASKETGGDDSTTVNTIDKSPEEHSKKKAKVSEKILVGMNNFADNLGIYFERYDGKIEMLGDRMSYAHDLSKKRTEVNDALRKLSITVESRVLAGMAITQDAQKVDHFFSLDDEEKMIMVKKLCGEEVV
ncbi:hypothetical protein RHSIM_Rhsim02G0144500 [Rhododendron simsii]|uniref:DDE Tnp4 domain-containing protein n=1 Tax=Rhododendron simsii TaxID=118357 RepID=A0A834H8F6_RHOSS|nr:hypothetical protein RHSIM_Rhsim02G0144500 [Rhododendron simsii]